MQSIAKFEACLSWPGLISEKKVYLRGVYTHREMSLIFACRRNVKHFSSPCAEKCNIFLRADSWEQICATFLSVCRRPFRHLLWRQQSFINFQKDTKYITTTLKAQLVRSACFDHSPPFNNISRSPPHTKLKYLLWCFGQRRHKEPIFFDANAISVRERTHVVCGQKPPFPAPPYIFMFLWPQHWRGL